ncbi:mitochondrial import inner membrane translocase subunit TIM17-1-like [Chenopodium quinoa]|uniref:mitochondrial import inner membrane translocase subunit TIM17-1-like n=1 Tax=Chenopodium quinoa TaxID=63459 RepID=UPI000B78C628|nr:mitochondrial import inner membrane translocase subunit TIM17-1-like [Chenopodium quinoa]
MAAYEGMKEPVESFVDLMADEVGTAFSLGTVGGFAYHFGRVISSGRRNFKLRRAFTPFRLACHRGPQVGGIGAVAAAAANAYQIADISIRQKNNLYTIFFSAATGGAAVAAKHGIRRASLSALCFGTGFTAVVHWFEFLRKEEDKLNYLDANSLSAPRH